MMKLDWMVNEGQEMQDTGSRWQLQHEGTRLAAVVLGVNTQKARKQAMPLRLRTWRSSSATVSCIGMPLIVTILF